MSGIAMDDVGVLPSPLREMNLGDDTIDFIFHFNRGSSNEDVDDDFIYSFFNGKGLPRQRPGVTHSTLNYDDSSPVIVYEKNRAIGEASKTASEILQSSGCNSREPRTDISCPVCMASGSEICSSRRYLVVTLCGHIFCNQCIEGIMERTKQCPTCRSAIFQSALQAISLSGGNSRESGTVISCPACAASVREIFSSDRYFSITICCHIICNKCMRKRRQCPTCRSIISQSTNRRLYF